MVVVPEVTSEVEVLRDNAFCLYVLLSDSKRAIAILAFSSKIALESISDLN